MHRNIIGILALVLAAPPVLAQPVLSSGTRIRIALVDGPRITGTVQGSGADTLRVALPGSELLVPLASVRSIETVVRRERRPARAVIVSSLATGLLGAVIGAAVTPECRAPRFCLGPAGKEAGMLTGFGVGAAIGIPIGIVIGAGRRHEIWARVYP